MLRLVLVLFFQEIGLSNGVHFEKGKLINEFTVSLF